MSMCIVNTGNNAGVNIRETKSRTSKLLGVIANGIEIDVVRCDATWATLCYGGQPAFVQHQYLEGEPTENGNGLEIGQEAYCNTNSVNVRNAANGSTILSQINKGGRYTIGGKENSGGYFWYYLGHGWVRGDFLTPTTNIQSDTSSGTNDSSEELGHLLFNHTTTIDVTRHGSGSTVNFRTIQGEVIEAIRNGSEVKIARFNGQWIPTKYNSKIGVMQAKFIKNTDEYNKANPANPLPYQFTDQVDTLFPSIMPYEYNPSLAVAYALNHSKTEATQNPPRPCSLSNDAFEEDGTGDCANFVHQCICAGGAPMFKGWSYSIQGIPSHWPTGAWLRTNEGRRKLLEKGWLQRIPYNSVMPGDIIYTYVSDYADKNLLTPYNHVTIAVTYPYTEGNKFGCRVCGHTVHQNSVFKELTADKAYCYRISPILDDNLYGDGSEKNVTMGENTATAQ